MSVPPTPKRIIQLAEEAYRQCEGLPFAVFLLSEDGIFLRYNEAGRKLFDLPPQPDFQQCIKDYYLHPGDREENLNRLYALPRGEWLTDTTLDLKIQDKVRYVRDFSKAVWDESGKAVAGLISLMINISRGDRYHRLFNELPVGIFSFRTRAGLINANPRFLEMHGYSDIEEVRRKGAGIFMRHPSNLEDLGKKLLREGGIRNEYQEHIRKDGTVFTASISASALLGKNGQLSGWEGILEDVTTQEIYLQLVNEVPIGLYHVRINDQGKHELLHCNQRFAENRGYSRKEMIGKDLRDFHPSAQAFREFYDILLEKDREGQELADHIIPLKNGRRYEVHIKLLKDHRGNITGRVGAERDVTDYLETRQQLDELTTDIGKVLHSYTSTLIHSKQTMDAVIRSFAEAPEIKGDGMLAGDEVILKKISHQISALDATARRILEKDKNIGHLGQAAPGELIRLLDLLKDTEQRQQEIQRLAVIRDVAIKIRKIINEAGKGNFPRELLKEARRQLREILRLSSLITLRRGVDAVLEMETTVNNLRGYILTRVKPKEPIQKLDLYDMLVGAAKTLETYASHRNVELRLNAKEVWNTYVDGYEDDLARALLNVLHNAVKYSWTRLGPQKAYVAIEAGQDRDWVYVSIENWGVAITPDELEKGLIFSVGYRGINSSDRRRPGTGLGLYDARKVIVEKHGGKLTVSSKPSLGNAENDYSHPFITTVTMQLPRNKKSL